jgi:hypothetical protein
MLLSDLAPIASAISGLTATASLIYVSIQTRLSIRHMRAQIHHGTAARTSNLLLGLMSSEAVTAWIEGNGGAPTPELIRERQFHYQCGLMMIAMEDYFSQHQQGLLGTEQFARGSATFRERLKGRAYGAIGSISDWPWSKQRRGTPLSSIASVSGTRRSEAKIRDGLVLLLNAVREFRLRHIAVGTGVAKYP